MNPDSITLFTLASESDILDSSITKDEYLKLPTFSGYIVCMYRVLGQVDVGHSPDGTALTETLKSAAAANWSGGASCFIPHHAIRVHKGDARWDILVCFMCSKYSILQKQPHIRSIDHRSTGMQRTWRRIVRKHGLRDISDKS